MGTIDDLARAIARDLSPEFERRLRSDLADRDREWLIDELVRLTLSRHGLEDLDRDAAANTLLREQRLQRVRGLALDHAGVEQFIVRNTGESREHLIEEGYLHGDVPDKGTALLRAAHRTERGEERLTHAKDVLFALLFGDDSTGSRLVRVSQELLTLAVPRAKAGALDFMRASTELAAEGTWQDPQSVSNDERADNVLLEVQFGETAD
ncbi:MAG: hypothetical protein ABI452_03040, partial [Candidatus Limnocylindrales bacterium]